jgi:hypothetical protein
MYSFDAAMSRFVNRQNLIRYRTLVREQTDNAKRVMILKLLAEEEAKFIRDMRDTNRAQTSKYGRSDVRFQGYGQ